MRMMMMSDDDSLAKSATTCASKRISKICQYLKLLATVGIISEKCDFPTTGGDILKKKQCNL